MTEKKREAAPAEPAAEPDMNGAPSACHDEAPAPLVLRQQAPAECCEAEPAEAREPTAEEYDEPWLRVALRYA